MKKDQLTWEMINGNRICWDCRWPVLAEKFYYWCIGCEKTQHKFTPEEMFNNGMF